MNGVLEKQKVPKKGSTMLDVLYALALSCRHAKKK